MKSNLTVTRRFAGLNSLILSVLMCLALPGRLSAQTMSVVNPLVENRLAPVGIDAVHPRFSWQLAGTANGLRQTAYQIQVAQSPEDLASGGQAFSWDSGWVTSDQNLLVPYAGAALQSSTPYFWRVRVRNQDNITSGWSPVARWVTGLLAADREFKADWIGYDEPYAETPHGADWFDIKQADWIVCPGLPKGRDEVVAYYRTSFEVPADATRITVGMDCNSGGQLFFNGIELLQGGKQGEKPAYLDITPWLRPGVNQLAVRVIEWDHRPNSGLIAAVRIECEKRSGPKVIRHFTDASWQGTLKPVSLWAGGEKPGDDWRPVQVLGKPGEPNHSGQGKDTLNTPAFGGKIFMPPTVCLRHEFELNKPVRFAVFHGTAQGLYDLHLNGRCLTPTGLQPGWTQFDKHTDYVSTDVTAALQAGRNAIGIELADGWFRGNLLWMGREHFGTNIRFSGQLEVTYQDGTRETFKTDPTWKAAYGPRLQSDIYMGEIYDARRELTGWDRPNFADSDWHPVVAESRPPKESFTQRAHPTEPVQPELELSPKRITEPHPGIYVVDFGQNLAGWARLQVSGQSGQNIYLRFGEDLNPDGTVYTDNLRSANPADRYVCKGGGVETWEPRFTYHGFRYVQIVGLTKKPAPSTLTAIVAHSGGPITSTFDSSSPMLNRLYQNVQWSQRGNYVETMTDCPQRDERYGWVGDAHFFMATSAYNQNGASFFTKWFLDCVDTQHEKTGNISNGAPGYRPGAGNAQIDWSAAMMIAPWTIWQRYGDAQPIRDNYDALRLYMTIWQKFAQQVDAHEQNKSKGEAPYKIIGDWVSLEHGTTREFIGRIFGYRLSLQMADFARITGHDADVTTFTALANHFRDEVIHKHIAPDGTVTGDTQTAYALVSRYHLYEPAQAPLIRAKFARRMQADNNTVLTGFHGTGNLLQGLTDIGLPTEAGKTILNETSPSWGGMVKLGATTIWERWLGKNANGGYFSPAMNSFNHYTFGGCGEWMMGWLVGLRPETPGFKKVHVEPTLIAGLDYAAGSFESPYGRVSNRWERRDGRIAMQLVIPPNSSAHVVLPSGAKQVTLQGQPVGAPPSNGQVSVNLESGTYGFAWFE